MIAANGVTARYLEQKGFPALRRVLRSPERWARIVELARDSGERLPPRPECQALQEFLEKRRQARSRALSGSVAFSGQVVGPRRIRARASRPAGGGTLWARREGLHSFDGAEPALSGFAHAAPAEGSAFRGADAVPQRRAWRIGAALHGAGGQRDQGGAAGAKVGGRTAARVARGRAVRRDRDGRFVEGDMGTNRPSRGGGKSRARVRGP